MNQSQTPKPAYVPGDRVLNVLNPNIALSEATTREVTFIGFDPEQPNVVLVRDVGNTNAPIRAVHSSYINALPKTDHRVVEVFARVSRTASQRCIVEHIADFSVGVDKPLRIIDARITEDGLLQVKVDMNAPVEVDAIEAAIANPCTRFPSSK